MAKARSPERVSGATALLVPILVAVIGAVASIATAWITASFTAKEEVRPLQQNAVGSLTEGQKLCSVVIPGAFRDSLIVPRSWKSVTCRQFQAQVGAYQYQLGCVFDEDTSWGDVNGGIPKINCGW
jgi:hypothetical protein